MKHIKFKFFYDGVKGIPNEQFVNEWLKDKNIEILNSYMGDGILYIFYVDDLLNIK